MRLSFWAGAVREPHDVLILASVGLAADSRTTISQLTRVTRVSRDGSVETHNDAAIEWQRAVMLLSGRVEIGR